MHRAIQNYMINKRVCELSWYPNVTVDRNRWGKGNIGFVDLVDSEGGAYEIKPEKYYAAAKKQLGNYVNASLRNQEGKGYTFESLKTGEKIFYGDVTVMGKVVDFSCNGDGIIAYRVRMDGEKSRVPVPAPKLRPQEEEEPFYGSRGWQMSPVPALASIAIGMACYVANLAGGWFRPWESTTR